jgi:Domain of unknown function (DUF4345)
MPSEAGPLQQPATTTIHKSFTAAAYPYTRDVRKIIQLAIGLAVIAAGSYLVLSPVLVADTLGKPHDTPTRLINLRASWGGTLAGLGAFIAWVPGFSPKWRAVVGLLMWAMAGIGAARLVGFALDGSPDARQYIWITAEVATVIACSAGLYLKRAREIRTD